MSGTGWRRTEWVEAVRMIAGDGGASLGKLAEVGDRDDGRDGRSTEGRMMPVSGVDVADARVEPVPVRTELVARGEATAEVTGLGEEMGWSSGMSSNSCRGLPRMSCCSTVVAREAAVGLGWSSSGPWPIGSDAFPLPPGCCGSFAGDDGDDDDA